MFSWSSQRYEVAAAASKHLVAYGVRLGAVGGGRQLFKLVLGAGCLPASTVSAYFCVQRDFSWRVLDASPRLSLWEGFRCSHGSGSFKPGLFDASYSFKKEDYTPVRVEVGGG
ncbi:MAG: hypothetical protein QW688_00810 [Thermoprotei archaeon]